MRLESFVILATVVALGAGRAHAQRPLPPQPASAPPSAAPAAETEKLSDADRISRIQRGIDETQAQLTQLRDRLGDPQGEFKKAEVEFTDLDSQFENVRKEVQRLKAENDPSVADRETALAEIEKKRTLARERFDLAIKERKATQDQIAVLEQKLQQDRDALNRLTGVTEPRPAPADPIIGPPASPPTTAETAAAPSTTKPGEPPATGAPAVPASAVPPEAATAAAPAATTAPATTTPAQPATAGPAAPPADPAKPPSEKIVKAQEEATTRKAEAEQAQQQALSITQRLESIRRVIENEKELRKTARQKADNARKTLQALDVEAEKKLAEGTPWSQLKEIYVQIEETKRRIAEADAEARARGEALDARHAELDALRAEHIAALEEAKGKMEAAEKARLALEQLQNPFAPENIWNWLISHGPKIGATVVIAFVLLWLIRIMESRIIRFITQHGVSGSLEERESRAKTLAGVLQNAGTVVVVVSACLLVIAEAGFNITTLLGATAVVGLAVAFGAQNLIRDYFYGFMILMENQYLVNDVVRLGSISGQVERITLRITVLRDLHGTVHFVPHGQVTTVSNLTRGWARAVMDVSVAYKEDVDRVMKVLADLGKEMRRDPAYRDLILDEPEVSGVDALGDSSVVVRFQIKTRPQKQWQIRREMLRRIKNKFDELGIEIPFPQRVVHTRVEPGTPNKTDGFPPSEEPVEEEWSASRSSG